ncbi:unnamed protein product [Rotaria sp. Silwood1]|nr:unnamed protein product [Rotaria sp. Silwood1]
MMSVGAASLLRNNDARNLLDEKLSNWFLPYGEKIDSIREPFFRQLLIAACLSSVRELLRRTRIRVSLNKARNMFGIIDEYNLLKPDEVFIQYTRLNDHEDKEKNDKCQNTRILSNCKVVITKNPCHHPGDIQTFTAVNREELKHLKDVIVFSQPGDCPASHQINESDLNGDEYAVIWYEDLVPLQIPNAVPFDYDSQKALPELDRPVNQDDINHVVLQIAESDYLGRLPNLHLAYTDSYGVGKKLYRSSRRMLPGWNGFLRRHRHLQLRTPEDDEEEQEPNADDSQRDIIRLDSSLLNRTPFWQDQSILGIASQLFYVYRQEMLEILNLYGLSHESDLWYRKSTNTTDGELEDTAYTQLEQLVVRTCEAFFLRLVCFCQSDRHNCNANTAFENLCEDCKKIQSAVAIALYQECYSGQNGLERAPILSLPWLFTTALIKTRQRELPSKQGLLGMAMATALNDPIHNRLLQLEELTLKFRTSNSRRLEANVHWTVCVFVEILHYCIKSKSFVSWSKILRRFMCKISSMQQSNPMDE